MALCHSKYEYVTKIFILSLNAHVNVLLRQTTPSCLQTSTQLPPGAPASAQPSSTFTVAPPAAPAQHNLYSIQRPHDLHQQQRATSLAQQLARPVAAATTPAQPYKFPNGYSTTPHTGAPYQAPQQPGKWAHSAWQHQHSMQITLQPSIDYQHTHSKAPRPLLPQSFWQQQASR
jgi:hypothetical protein